MTCQSCRHSFSAIGSKFEPVLMCAPTHRDAVIAVKVCSQYEREIGADEREEVEA